MNAWTRRRDAAAEAQDQESPEARIVGATTTRAVGMVAALALLLVAMLAEAHTLQEQIDRNNRTGLLNQQLVRGVAHQVATVTANQAVGRANHALLLRIDAELRALTPRAGRGAAH